MLGLSCSRWDLVLWWPVIQPVIPCIWELGVWATGPPGQSLWGILNSFLCALDLGRWFLRCQFSLFITVSASDRLPWWLRGKELAYQCRKCRRYWFNPWVRKIPWRRVWQPTPVFLPRESHGQRSLAGCSPWGRKDSDTAERLSMHTHKRLW